MQNKFKVTALSLSTILMMSGCGDDSSATKIDKVNLTPLGYNADIQINAVLPERVYHNGMYKVTNSTSANSYSVNCGEPTDCYSDDDLAVLETDEEHLGYLSIHDQYSRIYDEYSYFVDEYELFSLVEALSKFKVSSNLETYVLSMDVAPPRFGRDAEPHTHVNQIGYLKPVSKPSGFEWPGYLEYKEYIPFYEDQSKNDSIDRTNWALSQPALEARSLYLLTEDGLDYAEKRLLSGRTISPRGIGMYPDDMYFMKWEQQRAYYAEQEAMDDSYAWTNVIITVCQVDDPDRPYTGMDSDYRPKSGGEMVQILGKENCNYVYKQIAIPRWNPSKKPKNAEDKNIGF